VGWIVCLFLVIATRTLLLNFPRAWETYALRQCWRCCNGMSDDGASSSIWIRTASHCFIRIDSDTGPSCRSRISSARQVRLAVSHRPLCTWQATGTRRTALLSDHLPHQFLQFSLSYSILKLHIPLCFRIFTNTR